MEITPSNVLFSSDLWQRALENYANAAHLTVKVFDLDTHVIFGPIHPTPLFQLFEETTRYDPGIFAECARRCLTQANGRPAVMVSEFFGLTVVGTSLLLGDRIVGAAVAGYALVDFSQLSEVQRLARDSGIKFERLWQVAREQKPIPKQRLALNGELLQVLGDALLRDEQTVMKLEQTIRAKDEAHRELQETLSALREREQEVRLFAHNVKEYGLIQTDPQGKITKWNPGAQRLFGYRAEETLGANFSLLVTPEDGEANVLQNELDAAAAGKASEDSRWLVRKDSSRLWARSITEPIRDEAGHFRGVAKIIRDETEREKAEAFTRNSLAEKEQLLKEVHHRVKNNLQVIISLLNLQGQQIKEDHILTLFEETRNRVQSIASIHELLYRAESFASIDLATYARQLVPDLVRFYGLEQRIHIEITGEDVKLELERAVPYGMLVNELVSNSCKHAFSPLEKGQITITFQTDGRNIEMMVADNGRGLPEGFDYRRASSLGWKLIHGLVRQLRGTLAIRSETGTMVMVRFPVTEG